MSDEDARPVYAGFFGVMGASAAIVFSCKFSNLGALSHRMFYHLKAKSICKLVFNAHVSNFFFCPVSLFSALGAAYGTAKSGTGIAAMSVMRPDLIMKSVIPVVMAGIIAIYGLVVSVLIANKCKSM